MSRVLLLLCLLGFAPTTSAQGLVFLESLLDETGGVDGIDGAVDLTVSPDGAHLYVAGKTDDAVAVFTRDAGAGTLSFVELERDNVGGVEGLDRPVGVAVSPDGAHVYLAGDAEDAVVAFARNSQDGSLTFLAHYAPDPLQDRVFDVTLSPDGAHLYAASFLTDGIALYQRNAGTGALGFDHIVRDGVDGVMGLDGVRSLAVSSDGNHLYAASTLGEGAVAVFVRDGASGALTFAQVLRDGVAGVDGIAGAREVIVSPDGTYVYATGGTDDAVAHFSRAPTTGLLTFVAAVRVDEPPSPLDEANGLVVAPDGRRLYVTGRTADALIAFDRDPATGALSTAEIRRDQSEGVTGLDAPVAAALDPSGQHLYVASEAGDSVAVFVPEPSEASLGACALLGVAGVATRARRSARLSASPTE